MKTKRRIALILAVLATGLLCSCRGTHAEPDVSPAPEFDAAAYVRGGLDAVYLGRYSPEYLAMLGLSEEQCAAGYERGMAVSLDVFAEYFQIDLAGCSESMRGELMQLMRDVYALASYEVGKVSPVNGGFSVEVTVRPIAAVKLAAENDYPAFADDAARRLASGELSRGSSGFADWWAGQIAGMVRLRIAVPEYLDAQTVTVTLGKNADGIYAFSGTSLSDIDALILSYL